MSINGKTTDNLLFIRKPIFVFLLSMFSLFAQFEYMGDMNARGLGMAGITSAYLHDANAAGVNPAMLAYARRAHVSVMGSPQNIGLDDELGITTVNFVLSGVLPLGFAGSPGIAFNHYNVGLRNQGSFYQANQLTLSYGYALPVTWADISVGLSGRVQWWSIPHSMTGELTDEAVGSVTGNINASILLSPHPAVSLSVAGLNLVGANNSVVPQNVFKVEEAKSITYIPRTLEVGLALKDRDYRAITVDFQCLFPGLALLTTENKARNIYNLGVGGEVIFFDTVALRMGGEMRDIGALGYGMDYVAFWDLLNFSAGFGYIFKNVSFDLAYRYTIALRDFGTLALSLGVSFDSPIMVKPPTALAEERLERAKQRRISQERRMEVREAERKLQVEMKKRAREAKREYENMSEEERDAYEAEQEAAEQAEKERKQAEREKQKAEREAEREAEKAAKEASRLAIEEAERKAKEAEERREAERKRLEEEAKAWAAEQEAKQTQTNIGVKETPTEAQPAPENTTVTQEPASVKETPTEETTTVNETTVEEKSTEEVAETETVAPKSEETETTTKESVEGDSATTGDTTTTNESTASESTEEATTEEE